MVDQLQGLVELLDDSGSAVAIGFFLTEDTVVTCTHSLVDDRRGAIVDLRSVTSQSITRAEVIHSVARDGDTGDVAFLRVDAAGGRIPIELAAGEELGAECTVFGIHLAGESARVEVKNFTQGYRRLQIDRAQGETYEVRDGFSGTPLRLEHSGQVIGMVSGSDETSLHSGSVGGVSSRRKVQSARGIPSIEIKRIWDSFAQGHDRELRLNLIQPKDQADTKATASLFGVALALALTYEGSDSRTWPRGGPVAVQLAALASAAAHRNAIAAPSQIPVPIQGFLSLILQDWLTIQDGPADFLSRQEIEWLSSQELPRRFAEPASAPPLQIGEDLGAALTIQLRAGEHQAVPVHATWRSVRPNTRNVTVECPSPHVGALIKSAAAKGIETASAFLESQGFNLQLTGALIGVDVRCREVNEFVDKKHVDANSLALQFAFQSIRLNMLLPDIGIPVGTLDGQSAVAIPEPQMTTVRAALAGIRLSVVPATLDEAAPPGVPLGHFAMDAWGADWTLAQTDRLRTFIESSGYAPGWFSAEKHSGGVVFEGAPIVLQSELADRLTSSLLASSNDLHVILGPPRSGKSWAARHVADALANKGWSVSAIHSLRAAPDDVQSLIDAASRALSLLIGEQRLLVIDEATWREELSDLEQPLRALCREVGGNILLLARSYSDTSWSFQDAYTRLSIWPKKHVQQLLEGAIASHPVLEPARNILGMITDPTVASTDIWLSLQLVIAAALEPKGNWNSYDSVFDEFLRRNVAEASESFGELRMLAAWSLLRGDKSNANGENQDGTGHASDAQNGRKLISSKAVAEAVIRREPTGDGWRTVSGYEPYAYVARAVNLICSDPASRDLLADRIPEVLQHLQGQDSSAVELFFRAYKSSEPNEVFSKYDHGQTLELLQYGGYELGRDRLIQLTPQLCRLAAEELGLGTWQRNRVRGTIVALTHFRGFATQGENKVGAEWDAFVKELAANFDELIPSFPFFHQKVAFLEYVFRLREVPLTLEVLRVAQACIPARLTSTSDYRSGLRLVELLRKVAAQGNQRPNSRDSSAPQLKAIQALQRVQEVELELDGIMADESSKPYRLDTLIAQYVLTVRIGSDSQDEDFRQSAATLAPDLIKSIKNSTLHHIQLGLAILRNGLQPHRVQMMLGTSISPGRNSRTLAHEIASIARKKCLDSSPGGVASFIGTARHMFLDMPQRVLYDTRPNGEWVVHRALVEAMVERVRTGDLKGLSRLVKTTALVDQTAMSIEDGFGRALVDALGDEYFIHEVENEERTSIVYHLVDALLSVGKVLDEVTTNVFIRKVRFGLNQSRREWSARIAHVLLTNENQIAGGRSAVQKGISDSLIRNRLLDKGVHPSAIGATLDLATLHPNLVSELSQSQALFLEVRKSATLQPHVEVATDAAMALARLARRGEGADAVNAVRTAFRGFWPEAINGALSTGSFAQALGQLAKFDPASASAIDIHLTVSRINGSGDDVVGIARIFDGLRMAQPSGWAEALKQLEADGWLRRYWLDLATTQNPRGYAYCARALGKSGVVPARSYQRKALDRWKAVLTTTANATTAHSLCSMLGHWDPDFGIEALEYLDIDRFGRRMSRDRIHQARSVPGLAYMLLAAEMPERASRLVSKLLQENLLCAEIGHDALFDLVAVRRVSGAEKAVELLDQIADEVQERVGRAVPRDEVTYWEQFGDLAWLAHLTGRPFVVSQEPESWRYIGSVHQKLWVLTWLGSSAWRDKALRELDSTESAVELPNGAVVRLAICAGHQSGDQGDALRQLSKRGAVASGRTAEWRLIVGELTRVSDESVRDALQASIPPETNGPAKWKRMMATVLER